MYHPVEDLWVEGVASPGSSITPVISTSMGFPPVCLHFPLAPVPCVQGLYQAKDKINSNSTSQSQISRNSYLINKFPKKYVPFILKTWFQLYRSRLVSLTYRGLCTCTLFFHDSFVICKYKCVCQKIWKTIHKSHLVSISSEHANNQLPYQMLLTRICRKLVWFIHFHTLNGFLILTNINLY